MSKLVFASVISNIEQSDIFMTVKARICEAPMANLNGARVTEAFIDEIVNSPDRYVGLPLYADVRALTNGNYRRLGHLYDSKTGEFHSTQIGSFYQFEKEEFEYQGSDGTETGCRLIGYARIAKRNKKLSKAISELFTDGALKFSFEVAVGEYTELDDNTILIDASDSNYLEGTAIVTFPACEDAVALELVAQRKADDTEGGETEMKVDKKITAKETVKQPGSVVEDVAVAEENQTEQAESVEVQAKSTETAEATESTKEQPAETIAEPVVAQEEAASVWIDTTDRVEHEVHAYDTESGISAHQEVSISTSVERVIPDAQIVEADDGVHIAEAGDTAESDSTDTTETPAEEPAAETAQEESGDLGEPTELEDSGDTAEDPALPGENKKTAEQMIAELTAVVDGLKNEIAELKAQHIVAEKKTVTAEVNPFVDSLQPTGKYSLLQKENKQTFASYSLLS